MTTNIIGCAGECGRVGYAERMRDGLCPACAMERAEDDDAVLRQCAIERDEVMRKNAAEVLKREELMSRPMVFAQRAKVEMDAEGRVSRWDTDAPGAIVQADTDTQPTFEFGGMSIVSDEGLPRGAEYRDGRVIAMNPVDYAKLKSKVDRRATVPVPAELTVAAWSAELMFSWRIAPDNPMCRPLVWVLRHREQKMPDQRVYTGWTSPHKLAPQIKEYEARRIAAAKFNAKKDESLGEAKMFGLPSEKPGRLPANVRTVMVNEIIASQVAAGGVDTEGTRHEAERWCAMLAGCVCEGMRATTRDSAYRLTPIRVWHEGDKQCVARGDWCAVGEPLGRP